MAARGVFVFASKEGGPDWQDEWLRQSACRHLTIEASMLPRLYWHGMLRGRA